MRLPLDEMLASVNATDPDDKDCHVMALVAEVKLLTETCAVAYRHLLTYGTLSVGYAGKSQQDALAALRPFVRGSFNPGEGVVSVYADEDGV